MRGGPEEGGPNAENGTFINGFHETWPIVYGEDAFGFARTGQTICNVTDSKIIKLFVDDEPFWLPQAKLLNYDRRLNMKAGTLDREILWRRRPASRCRSDRGGCVLHRPARGGDLLLRDAPRRGCRRRDRFGDGVAAIERRRRRRRSAAGAGLCRSRAPPARRLFQRMPHRAVPCDREEPPDPRMRDRKHAGNPFPHSCKTVHSPDFGQVAFTIEARSAAGPPQQYMVYHTSQTATAEELCGRAEWTLDRVTAQGFDPLLSAQARYLDDFWRRSDVRIKDVREERTQRTTVEIQQAIRFNLFHILQASARRKARACRRKASRGNRTRDTISGTPKSTFCRS